MDPQPNDFLVPAPDPAKERRGVELSSLHIFKSDPKLPLIMR